jgi:two-component system, LytTR family, sensor kinase
MYWLCWLGVSLFFNAVYGQVTTKSLTSMVVLGIGFFFLSELMGRYMMRRGWVDSFRSQAPRTLAMSILASLVLQMYAGPILVAGFHIGTWADEFSRIAILRNTMQGTLMFWCWGTIYSGIALRRRFQRSEMERLQLEAAVQAAELRALKSQVNPHFLFNCLNNLRSLVAEDPERAREMMLRLSELLRYALEVSRHERVTLEEELSVVEAYLELESLQFEDRLRWEVKVSEEGRRAKLPPMVVQQLVENAIKHGISKRPHGGEITIRGSVEEGALMIDVENSGQLPPTPGSGFGLENARQRLRLLSGELARLTLSNRDSDHVAATASIPLS